MSSAICAPSLTTTQTPFCSKRINILSIKSSSRAEASHRGVFLSGSTSPEIKQVYTKTDNFISANSAQTLIYDSDVFTVFIAGLEAEFLDVEIRRSLTIIAEIAALEENWNGNGAPAFSQQLIKRCKCLIKRLKYQPDIFPTAQESIQFEWNGIKGDYVEVELFENGVCNVAHRTIDGKWTELVANDSMIGEYVEKFFT